MTEFPLLPKVELDLIFATLDFANAELGSVRQVEGFFRNLPLPRRWWQTIEGEPGALEEFERNQVELRRWLHSIATNGIVKRTEQQVIDRRLHETVKVSAVVLGFEDGELVERRTYLLEGVRACYAFATALILRFGDRLGECPFPKCGRFFFDIAMRGRRSKYCSTKHENADRQRRHRRLRKSIITRR